MSVCDLWPLAEAAFGADAEAARARVETLRRAEVPAASGSSTPPPPFTSCPAAVLRALRSLWANLDLPGDVLDVPGIQAGDAKALRAATTFLRAAGKGGGSSSSPAAAGAAPWEAATSTALPRHLPSAAPGGGGKPWWQVLGLGKGANGVSGGVSGGDEGIKAARPAVAVEEATPPPVIAVPAAAADGPADYAEPADPSNPRPSSIEPDAAARSAGLAAAARLAQGREALLAALAAARPGRAAADAAHALMRVQFELAEAQVELARAAAVGVGE